MKVTGAQALFRSLEGEDSLCHGAKGGGLDVSRVAPRVTVPRPVGSCPLVQ